MTVEENFEQSENVVKRSPTFVFQKPEFLGDVVKHLPASNPLCFSLQVNFCPTLGRSLATRLLGVIETEAVKRPEAISNFREWFRPELIKRGLLKPSKGERDIVEKKAFCPRLVDDIARQYSKLIEELTVYRDSEE